MTTFLFPGQGSQLKGMGDNLFSYFSDLTFKASEFLGYCVKSLCLNDSDHQLNQTQYTQPALYVVNVFSYLKKLQDTGLKPNYVVGHSLGEYSALFAAGVFDFITGLSLVKKRGELMGKIIGGSMAVVVGLREETIKILLLQEGLTNITIANNNSYLQFVLSGLKEDIDKSLHIFKNARADLVIPLRVSGAFHSPYMEEVQQQFNTFLNEFTFSAPSIPVISNYTAKPYFVTDLKKNLVQQITHPVRWIETINYLMQQGETKFEEVGPGKVLTGLVRSIQNGK